VIEVERAVTREREVIEEMEKGGTFQKLTWKGGRMETRTYVVSDDLLRLEWGGGGQARRRFFGGIRGDNIDTVRFDKYIWISDIVEIRSGQRTTNFSRVPNRFKTSPSFSIITATRSIDLVCPSNEICEVWQWGLRWLTKRLGGSSINRIQLLNSSNPIPSNHHRSFSGDQTRQLRAPSNPEGGHDMEEAPPSIPVFIRSVSEDDQRGGGSTHFPPTPPPPSTMTMEKLRLSHSSSQRERGEEEEGNEKVKENPLSTTSFTSNTVFFIQFLNIILVLLVDQFNFPS